MSRPTQLTLAGRAGIAVAACLAFGAVPVAAQASAVHLATAGPFVALAGSTITNAGPSVLNGDLGVAAGTALVGFGLPAVVNGVTHDNDGVASQAQSDLATAYDVAAGQPVAPANDLTGADLGSRTLTAGAYRYTSSAQLTGRLTLDAKGDPNAQFVFEIGSALTTAPASSVALINGASPCNVYWQVGSSATLDSTTLFQGNLMALTSISLNNRAVVIGRVLARNGQISLINNVLHGSMCGTGSSSSPSPTGTTPSGPAGSPSGPSAGDVPTVPAGLTRIITPARRGTAIMRRTRTQTCASGFSATVRGHMIKRVVFSLDGKRIASRTRSPFGVFVRASSGAHWVRARVTFKDATRAKTMKVAYHACAAALLQPVRGPSKFTG